MKLVMAGALLLFLVKWRGW